jgi:2-(1,2-epoxy-1,2-dihydrophenyl)acetyl-CoA isomerase
VGVRRAQELMLTNRRLSAADAAQWGLVTEVVPDDTLAERAEALTVQMSTAARLSSSSVRKLLLMSFSNGLEEQMEIEGRMIAACAGSADGQEGIDAFLNKRRPEFA